MSQKKFQSALDFAKQIHAGRPAWTALHNAIFGIGGTCSQLSDQEHAAFCQSPEYAEIWSLIEDLQGDENETSGVITVRLPRSMHYALRKEAEAEDTSVNQLIVAKLAANLVSLLQ